MKLCFVLFAIVIITMGSAFAQLNTNTTEIIVVQFGAIEIGGSGPFLVEQERQKFFKIMMQLPETFTESDANSMPCYIVPSYNFYYWVYDSTIQDLTKGEIDFGEKGDAFGCVSDNETNEAVLELIASIKSRVEVERYEDKNGMHTNKNLVVAVRYDDHVSKNEGLFLNEAEKQEFLRTVVVCYTNFYDNFYYWTYSPTKMDISNTTRRNVNFNSIDGSLGYALDGENKTAVLELLTKLKNRMSSEKRNSDVESKECLQTSDYTNRIMAVRYEDVTTKKRSLFLNDMEEQEFLKIVTLYYSHLPDRIYYWTYDPTKDFVGGMIRQEMCFNSASDSLGAVVDDETKKVIVEFSTKLKNRIGTEKSKGKIVTHEKNTRIYAKTNTIAAVRYVEEQNLRENIGLFLDDAERKDFLNILTLFLSSPGTPPTEEGIPPYVETSCYFLYWLYDATKNDLIFNLISSNEKGESFGYSLDDKTRNTIVDLLSKVKSRMETDKDDKFRFYREIKK